MSRCSNSKDLELKRNPFSKKIENSLTNQSHHEHTSRQIELTPYYSPPAPRYQNGPLRVCVRFLFVPLLSRPKWACCCCWFFFLPSRNTFHYPIKRSALCFTPDAGHLITHRRVLDLWCRGRVWKHCRPGRTILMQSVGSGWVRATLPSSTPIMSACVLFYIAFRFREGGSAAREDN